MKNQKCSIGRKKSNSSKDRNLEATTLLLA